MLIERFVNGRARSNAYVVVPEATAGSDADGAALVVDPGVGANHKIDEFLRREGLRPAAVLITHGHPDHVWTLREFAEPRGIVSYYHPHDRGWFEDPATGGHVPVIRWGGRLVGRWRKLHPERAEDIGHGHEIDAAGVRVAVLHTPGHTRGSVCFRIGDVLFAGDTVFRGNLGHTAYPGGSKASLRESVRTKLLPLPDDVRLFPGHGGETTVGDERRLWERET